MKKLILGMFLLVLGAVLAGWWRVSLSVDQAGNEGKALREQEAVLAVDPGGFDFGRVKYGDIPTTEFKLSNAGEKKISITRLSTSCGCTTATIIGYQAELTEGQTVVLEPGKSVSMEVAFNPAIHGDDTDLGRLTRTVYIKTDDPKLPETTVTIEAEVYK